MAGDLNNQATSGDVQFISISIFAEGIFEVLTMPVDKATLISKIYIRYMSWISFNGLARSLLV